MNQALDALNQELSRIQKEIEQNQNLLLNPEYAELKEEIELEIQKLEVSKAELENSVMEISGDYSSKTSSKPGGPSYNPNVAVMEIRAGAGGTEAGIFARDLYRMYLRYCEKNRFKTTETAMSEDENGAIKTVIFEIKGLDAYNTFKNESGVHRVQRVPSTEAYGRIHTSTATITVLPEFKDIQIEIKPDDLEWDFFRSGGKGGQNVNKVSTGARVTHKPTGMVVECTEDRTQGKNREKALSYLQARLYKIMQDNKMKEISELRGEQVTSADRSEKIRTYNFPQDRITDHRIDKNFGNISAVMQGEIGKILEECRNIKTGEDSE